MKHPDEEKDEQREREPGDLDDCPDCMSVFDCRDCYKNTLYKEDIMTTEEMKDKLQTASLWIDTADDRNEEDGQTRGGFFSKLGQMLLALRHITLVLSAVVEQLDAIQHKERDA